MAVVPAFRGESCEPKQLAATCDRLSQEACPALNSPAGPNWVNSSACSSLPVTRAHASDRLVGFDQGRGRAHSPTKCRVSTVGLGLHRECGLLPLPVAILALIVAVAVGGVLASVVNDPQAWFPDAFAAKGPTGEGPEVLLGHQDHPGPVGPDAQDAVDSVSSDVDDLTSQVEDLSSSLDDLETGTGDQSSTSIDELSASVDDLSRSVDDLSSQVSDLDLRLSDLESRGRFCSQGDFVS